MKLKGLYILDKGAFNLIYGPEEQKDIVELVDIIASPQNRDSIAKESSLLKDIDVIISGWGGPVMNAQFLSSAPNLKAVFYGAGSIRNITSDEFWNRRICITSAYAANAIPVAEYTSSVILLSLKSFWRLTRIVRTGKSFPKVRDVSGAYKSTVGLVSMGMIGRLVRERLRSSELRVVAFDPFLSSELAGKLGVESVSLDQLFRESDVVSLHTPWLPETEGMITGRHFESMKTGATFINSARGAVVRETEMVEVLNRRQDLTAILDVTYPEPPGNDSPLYTLPNVVLTPHIAGSMGLECRRMGRYMVEELRRYLAGQQLKWNITKEMAKNAA
ncbi:MAG TPA: glycerate dehydrogenase [Lentisphaeria bacterium]|nr:MAG: glycerate dehydrogenase [Lentisphaerae bacterium GWF2_49_21]HBC89325.1 glycerate dehydrogenase [Lentisphaeria bacterium]